MADDECCGVDKEQIHSPGYRRALWIVVILNVGYGIFELFGGFLANSQSLKADALDFLGDGSITLLALLAIGWSIVWRARSALIQGVFLGLLGLWVFASTLLKTLTDTPVEAGLMGMFAFIALIVNVIAVLPLLSYREGDANMRAVWLFSRNDAIGNVLVIIAAGLVALTSTRWPDLIVAFLIAALFLHSAWNIVRDARRDLHNAEAGKNSIVSKKTKTE
jgi:cation diffusion facilitator family transporter|tara:strand:- start:717 stop:1376 length:660 start_codon:yes stop_codon:yes gene_type:complete